MELPGWYLEVHANVFVGSLMPPLALMFSGVLPAGMALLDAQGYTAALTVEASDEPHGVVNFALSSRFLLLQEANVTIQLFINREFGSLGLSLRNEVGFPGESCSVVWVRDIAEINQEKNPFIYLGQDYTTRT